jgi:hypothetical protein
VSQNYAGDKHITPQDIPPRPTPIRPKSIFRPEKLHMWNMVLGFQFLGIVFSKICFVFFISIVHASIDSIEEWTKRLDGVLFESVEAMERLHGEMYGWNDLMERLDEAFGLRVWTESVLDWSIWTELLDGAFGWMECLDRERLNGAFGMDVRTECLGGRVEQYLDGAFGMEHLDGASKHFL